MIENKPDAFFPSVVTSAARTIDGASHGWCKGEFRFLESLRRSRPLSVIREQTLTILGR